MIIKPPDMPLVLAEGKLVEGYRFAPTGAQYIEGLKWQAAKIECVLIGLESWADVLLAVG